MTHPTRGFIGSYTRADLGVLAALVASAVFVAVMIIPAPCMVGAYQDDGVYLVTAKALADGQGYRHLELPGEPFQTKYPILYPLLLALIWRIFPNFPDNVTVIQLVNITLWTAGSWIAYRLMRRVWELPWWLPACGVLLVFPNTMMLGLLQTAMAEPLFFLLSLAALALLSPANSVQTPDDQARSGTVRAVLGGLLAGAAFLSRSIGLALIVAILAGLLLRRRWKAVVAVGVIAAMFVGGWRTWCVYASAANADNPALEAFHYDLDYGSWLPGTLGELSWVVYHNISESALAFMLVLTPPPYDWSTRLLQSGFGSALPLYLGMIVTCGLVLVGLVVTWRRARPTIQLYLLAYLGLVLIWPFQPQRFLIPILPLLITLLLAGLYHTVVFIAGSLQRLLEEQPVSSETAVSAKSRPGAGMAIWLVVLLALVLGYQSVQAVLRQPGRLGLKQWLDKREELVDLVQARTPPEAVICSPYTGYLHLQAGRKFVPFVPSEDPISYRYPDDRKFSACGRLLADSEVDHNLHLVNTRLMNHLRTTGATYWVQSRKRSLDGIAFEEFRRTHPRYFRRIGDNEQFTLYRVVPPRR